jgi:hypothetical protein
MLTKKVARESEKLKKYLGHFSVLLWLCIVCAGFAWCWFLFGKRAWLESARDGIGFI